MIPTTPAITVASCDDHELVRTSLCNLIDAFGEFKVVLQANNGASFIAKLDAAEDLPDICLLDIQMSPMTGWETLARIKKKWPDCIVLMLTCLEIDEIADNLNRYGANGYLSKNCSAIDLHHALTYVFREKEYFPLGARVLLRERAAVTPKPLSDREEQFLRHCVNDVTMEEIANEMHVSPRTVDNYRDALFHKLKVKSRIGLVLFAIKSGIAMPFRK